METSGRSSGRSATISGSLRPRNTLAASLALLQPLAGSGLSATPTSASNSAARLKRIFGLGSLARENLLDQLMQDKSSLPSTLDYGRFNIRRLVGDSVGIGHACVAGRMDSAPVKLAKDSR